MTTNVQHGPQGRTERPDLRAIQSVSTDLRTMVRHLLHARVIFHWNDDEGSQRAGRGQTRNISRNGAYVVSPEHPPKGAQISMIIYLPPLPGDTRVHSIEAQGQVLRVEPKPQAEDSAGCGFAVSNHRVILSTT